MLLEDAVAGAHLQHSLEVHLMGLLVALIYIEFAVMSHNSSWKHIRGRWGKTNKPVAAVVSIAAKRCHWGSVSRITHSKWAQVSVLRDTEAAWRVCCGGAIRGHSPSTSGVALQPRLILVMLRCGYTCHEQVWAGHFLRRVSTFGQSKDAVVKLTLNLNRIKF